ncbi:O-antigen ligase family protein [Devosia nitrariae]|nr:O-antigen ligase family protein [Devosia nitrariae]
MPLRIRAAQLSPLPVLALTIIAFLLMQLLPLRPAWQPISFTPGATVLMLLRWLTYAVLFFLVLQATRNRHRFDFFMDAVLAIGALHTGAALFMLRSGDTLLGYPKLAYIGSATGTFINRNSFATFAALTCCLGIAQLARALLAVGKRREIYRGDLIWLRLALTLGAFLVAAAALVASQSRMGATAGVAGVLVTFLVIISARLHSRAKWVLLSALIAGGGLAALQGGPLIERLLELEQSWDIRLALYQQVVDLILARPWTGFGGGSFELIYPSVHALPVAPDRVWDKAHNTYLTLAAELGLPIATAAIALFAAMGWMLIRGLVRDRRRWFAASLGLGLLTVVGVHGLVDFSMEIQAVTIWLISLTAASLAQCVGPQANTDPQEVP